MCIIMGREFSTPALPACPELRTEPRRASPAPPLPAPPLQRQARRRSLLPLVPVPWSLFPAPTIFRIFVQVPYPLTPVFSPSSQNCRGVPRLFPKRNVPAVAGTPHSKGNSDERRNCRPHTSQTPCASLFARTPSGRRCRMAISDPRSSLCFRHAAVRLKGG